MHLNAQEDERDRKISFQENIRKCLYYFSSVLNASINSMEWQTTFTKAHFMCVFSNEYNNLIKSETSLKSQNWKKKKKILNDIVKGGQSHKTKWTQLGSADRSHFNNTWDNATIKGLGRDSWVDLNEDYSPPPFTILEQLLLSENSLFVYLFVCCALLLHSWADRLWLLCFTTAAQPAGCGCVSLWQHSQQIVAARLHCWSVLITNTATDCDCCVFVDGVH